MQVKFLTQLNLTNDPHDDGNWLLVRDFLCAVNGLWMTIPAGFRTDLASVPRIFWAFFPPFGRWDEAAVLHDYMYRVGGSLSREDADACFHAGMLECGVPEWRAYIMWAAVRLFGGSSYKVNP